MNPIWRSELLALLRLALPVVTVQVGMTAMGFVDAIMLGQYSEIDLAAAGLGNFYSLNLMMFGMGVLVALDPVMSQAVGARDDRAITTNMQRGFVLAMALMIPTAAVFMLVEPALGWLGQDPALVPLASTYVWILIPSILPFFCFQILRTTLQSYHRTAPVVWTILVANLANLFLNWVLIYGHLGLAPLGVQGSAIATLVSRWLMFLVLLGVGWPLLWRHLAPWSRQAFDLVALRRLTRIGVPVGTQMVLEFGAFGITLVFMGWISVSALAGHQAAINLASMTYVVTLGLSQATSIRVGNGVGRGELSGARWSAVTGLLAAMLIMGVFALLFLLIPESLAALFSRARDAGAREVAALLVPIAAWFQIVDGVQVVALGVLRGVADTKMPLLISLLGFWCLGVPCSYWFAFGLGGGAEGLWWGLTVGLTAVAICLTTRVWWKLRGNLSRTVIDDSDALDPA